MGFARGSRTAPGAGALAEARATRFAELDALEQAREAGTIGAAAYADERSRLVASLEDIYARLDERA